jgi:hypothetical protein
MQKDNFYNNNNNNKLKMIKYKWSNGTLAERTLLKHEDHILLLKLEYNKKMNQQNAQMSCLYMDENLWNIMNSNQIKLKLS